MSIIVLGTVALDTVETPLGKRTNMLGGSAVHFSMSARLFTDVHIAAVVGEDFPVHHLRFLTRRKVNVASVAPCPGETFRWEGSYSGDMNVAKTHATHLGVLVTGRTVIQPAQQNIPYVFLANYDPDAQMEFLSRIKKPALVALDTMNYYIHSKRPALLRALKRADILMVNDQEARDLSQESSLRLSARCLMSQGPRLVVIKKGEHGVVCFYGKEQICLPAFVTRRVVDPTGAGDTFAGGFMGYCAQAKKINLQTLKKALIFGTVAASFNVEGFGVERTKAITRQDLAHRLKAFKKQSAL